MRKRAELSKFNNTFLMSLLSQLRALYGGPERPNVLQLKKTPEIRKTPQNTTETGKTDFQKHKVSVSREAITGRSSCRNQNMLGKCVLMSWFM